MQELNTRDICEFLVFYNLSNNKIKEIKTTGIYITLSFGAINIYNSAPLINESIITLFLIIMIKLSIFYMAFTFIITHLYLRKIKKFISLNIKILLPEVNLEILKEAYIKAKEENISDKNLLKFLQDYSKKNVPLRNIE